MELFIAGGCGEHGRNCFLLQNGEEAVLVDCGLLAGASNNLPRLAPEQIAKIKAVFLTHSHADHTGALPWLREQGCRAPVIAASPTLEQLPFAIQGTIPLESICPRGTAGALPQLANFTVAWGRSGHCAGSVWYKFVWGSEQILFSGDYSEQSRVYPCDTLRNETANLAVLDCAYGTKTTPLGDCSKELYSATEALLRESPLAFLPVPKYGRGLDLLLALHAFLPQFAIYGDVHFCAQAKAAAAASDWYKPLPDGFASWAKADCDFPKGVLFLSDPQLRGAAGQRAKQLLTLGAHGLMTGTPDAGSLSMQLLQEGKMRFSCFPVHLNAVQCANLAEQNHFKKVVRYHCPEITCESTVLI